MEIVKVWNIEFSLVRIQCIAEEKRSFSKLWKKVNLKESPPSKISFRDVDKQGRIPGPDPHVAGPKAHARCGASFPLCQLLPSCWRIISLSFFPPFLPNPLSPIPFSLCSNFYFFFPFVIFAPLSPSFSTTKGPRGAPQAQGPWKLHIWNIQPTPLDFGITMYTSISEHCVQAFPKSPLSSHWKSKKNKKDLVIFVAWLCNEVSGHFQKKSI